MNIQQQLLPLVRKTGLAALLVLNAAMVAVVVLLVDTAESLVIANAYLLLFVKIWQVNNVNSMTEHLQFLEDFG